MKKFVLIAMTAMTLLSACNTISGMGKDVKAAGNAVSNTAEKRQNLLICLDSILNAPEIGAFYNLRQTKKYRT